MMDVSQIHQKLTDLGIDWADKDAAANLLEETKKITFSECVLKYKDCSNIEAEHRARVDPDFINAMNAAVRARKDANRAKVTKVSAEVWLDVWRTKEATKRAEMNLR